ncbi:MAG: hypothetical protein ACYDIE_09765 [Candidatus Krumholzibacteriia bacterium]
MRGYPTFVLVDAAGDEIDRLVGYGGVPSFVAALDAALADPLTVARREERFRVRPTAADAVRLARVAAGRGEAARAVTWYREAQRLDPAADYTYDTFDAVAAGFRRQTATAAELRAAADAVFASPRAEPEQLLTVGYVMSSSARRAQDPSLRRPYLALALERTAGVTDPALRGDRRELEIEYDLHIAHARDRALALKRETLGEGWRDDAGALNGFAWWCFENRVNLREAAAFARRSAELAPDAAARAAALDTAAEISAARGHPRGALELARAAAAADPGKESYRRQVTRFAAAARRAADRSR